jgi:hypothetical protein
MKIGWSNSRRNRQSLAESSKEGYGSKEAVLPMMMIMKKKKKKSEVVKGGWRKLHNKKFIICEYSLSNIIRIIKSRNIQHARARK